MSSTKEWRMAPTSDDATGVVTWAVGSTNRTKIESVQMALARCFPSQENVVVVGVPVESTVSAQPMSVDETRRGAEARARAALHVCTDAEFGVGAEGGIEKVGNEWFESAWICVVRRDCHTVGWGSNGRFQLSNKIVKMIIDEKKELATIMDELSGRTDVRSTMGAMGILTNDALQRAEGYCHGVIYALAPFLSHERYWI